ncbi:MAG: hypothetical protein AAF903_03190 [Pseudomonadota bacterium]
MEWLIDLSEVLRNVGLAAAAAVGVYLAWLRLGPEATQADATIAQAELARRAHVTELMNRAAGQLNDAQLEVRLAAIYVLREVGRDFPDLANPVFELLQAHLRVRSTTLTSSEDTPDIDAILKTLKARMEK